MEKLKSLFKPTACFVGATALTLSAQFLAAHEDPANGHTHENNPLMNSDNFCETGSNPYITFDLNSGQIITANRENQYVRPASTSKVVTTIVSLNSVRDGHTDLEQRVGISNNSIAYGERFGGADCDIRKRPALYNDFNVDKALIAADVRSCNDAAEALAPDIIRDNIPDGEPIPSTRERVSMFVSEMNDVADSLNMQDTNYTSASGVPLKGGHTTPKDLGRLMLAVRNDREDDVLPYLSIEETDIPLPKRGNTITLMRTLHEYMPEHEDITLWGKTGFVDERRGGAIWMVGFEDKHGADIGVITFCHPEATAEQYRIRETATMDIYLEARELANYAPYSYRENEFLKWTPPETEEEKAARLEREREAQMLYDIF